jgi:hypothetical protein
VVAGLVVMAFVTRYVLRNWDEVRQADLAWDLSIPVLVVAVGVVWLTFAALADAWRRMVSGWGTPIGWWDGARIWLLSSMAKYVPGKVWALAGMAVMSERRGVPAWAAAASALILQALSLGTGAAVVAASGLVVAPRTVPGTAALLGLAAGSLVLSGMAVWPPLTRRIIATVAPGAEITTVPHGGTVVIGFAVNLLAWIGYGTAFWLFARGTLPSLGLGLGTSIGAFTASYVAGVIAPFAPGGLGVREGVLVVALRSQVGLAGALALAAVARLGMTLAEVLATLPFLIRLRGTARV